MGLIWIVVGVAIASVLAKRIMRNCSSESDLGFVSHQWIAEPDHRGGDRTPRCGPGRDE